MEQSLSSPPRPAGRRPRFSASLLAGLLLLAGRVSAQYTNFDDPTLAFFPPPTPMFGSAALNNASSIMINGVRRREAPEELAAHVGEFFYPALGTRLSRGSLAKETSERLKTYTDTRLAVLNELKSHLDALQNADAATRERELRAFAPTQAAALAALERDAEQLRDELVRGGLLKSSANWNDERGWHLGDKTIQATAQPRAEARIVRATAYYEPGLTIEQRGLVRELGLQLEEQTRVTLRRPAAPDPNVVFFSPATSRLRLPSPSTPALNELFGKFFHDREELKKELRDTINAKDAAGEKARARAWADLAASQAPRLRALEQLADEIRQQLAALPPPAPPKLTHLPPVLVQLYDTITREQRVLATGMAGLLKSAASPTSRLRLTGGPDEIRKQVQEMNEARLESLKQAQANYRQENAARYAALEQQRAVLRQGLEEFAAQEIDPATGGHPNPVQLLRELEASNQAFDALGRDEVIYKDYKIAMLEPGLSAAQRRLLFNAALAGLSQPLPPGEVMPGEQFR